MNNAQMALEMASRYWDGPVVNLASASEIFQWLETRTPPSDRDLDNSVEAELRTALEEFRKLNEVHVSRIHAALDYLGSVHYSNMDVRDTVSNILSGMAR